MGTIWYRVTFNKYMTPPAVTNATIVFKALWLGAPDSDSPQTSTVPEADV